MAWWHAYMEPIGKPVDVCEDDCRLYLEGRDIYRRLPNETTWTATKIKLRLDGSDLSKYYAPSFDPNDPDYDPDRLLEFPASAAPAVFDVRSGLSANARSVKVTIWVTYITGSPS